RRRRAAGLTWSSNNRPTLARKTPTLQRRSERSMSSAIPWPPDLPRGPQPDRPQTSFAVRRGHPGLRHEKCPRDAHRERSGHPTDGSSMTQYLDGVCRHPRVCLRCRPKGRPCDEPHFRWTDRPSAGIVLGGCPPTESSRYLRRRDPREALDETGKEGGAGPPEGRPESSPAAVVQCPRAPWVVACSCLAKPSQNELRVAAPWSPRVRPC